MGFLSCWRRLEHSGVACVRTRASVCSKTKIYGGVASLCVHVSDVCPLDTSEKSLSFVRSRRNEIESFAFVGDECLNRIM